MKRITRREALKLGALAGGSLLLPIAFNRPGYTGNAGSPVTAPFQLPFRVPPVLDPLMRDDIPGTYGNTGNKDFDFEGTDYYVITQKLGQQQIIPLPKNKLSAVWGYNGIFPGPTIKARKGRRTVIRQINQLPTGVETTVHLHGMAALPQYDGYADDLIPSGYYKDYYYPNNRAATLWYHDHCIHRTAFNVYNGMAGFYIVQDDYELSLPLPKGEYDVPLFLHDKQFSSNGSVVFDDNGEKHVMGDVITVNGVAWPRMEVANRKYRFRILNGSISRSYRLALSTREPLIVIGTDAGLLPSPVPVKEFRIGTAERYEVVIDFSKYKIGTRVILQNLELPIDVDYDQTNVVMCFDVVRDVKRTEGDDSEIPSKLNTRYEEIPVSSAVRTREFRFERNNGLWTVNGKTWDMNRIDANPGLGDVEIWKLTNNAGGWFHPVHIHLVDLQMLDRNGKKPFIYERGWKDVFYLGPNESVRVIAKFELHEGKYMLHCHNTVHEDHDMMIQWEVGKGRPEDDPMSKRAIPIVGNLNRYLNFQIPVTPL